MANQTSISFGIEFEFIVPQATGVDRHPHDSRFYHTSIEYDHKRGNDIMGPVIVDVLKNVVPMIVLDDNTYRTYLKLAKERGTKLAAGHPLPYSYFWRYSYEGTLQPKRAEDVEGNYNHWTHPVEVSSRTLGEHEFYEVAEVYRKLRESVRINLNSSCSFHVHVGTAHLGIIGYQKLVTLMIVCEHFMWKCCQTFRRDGPWCLSISKYSKTARVPTSSAPSQIMESLVPSGILPADVHSSLGGIWTAASFLDLQEQLLVPFGRDEDDIDYHHRGAFCLRDHDEEDIYGDLCSTTTAEFRYSHASGDAERDHCFVRICIALVRAAELDGSAYTDMIASFAKGGDFSNFLGPLGLQDLYAYWTAAEREYLRKAAQPMQPATEFLPRV